MNTKELENRVHELEAQNAALRAAAHTPGGVTITTLPESPKPLPNFPSFDELVGLMLAVYRRHPKLKPEKWSAGDGAARRDLDWMTSDDHFLAAQFKKAFQWQRTVFRSSLDPSRVLDHAVEKCAHWLLVMRQDNVPPGGKIVLAALIAAGDVAFLDPATYPLNMMQLGLYCGGNGGRPADHTAWHRVLSGDVQTGLQRESARQMPQVTITELNVAAHHRWRQGS